MQFVMPIKAVVNQSLKHIIFCCIAALLLAGCSKSPEVISLAGSTMGTTYHIKVVANERMPDAQLLQARIDLLLDKVNNEMSTYRPNSELSQFNALEPGQPIQVSDDTIKVIQEGIRLNKTTDGALDITLGPLVNLWGFGPDKRPTKIPTQATIDATMARTGIDGIEIDGNQLLKSKPSLYVDLSSIAKGFGVDKVAEMLEDYQPQGYLVEIGGEVRAKGTKPGNLPWRIAVEKPTEQDREVQQVIEPGNIAMATSGDYRIYYEEDGERFTHIIDPRTGYPVKHRLASVTVLNKQCMTADGYATAMMVLGTEKSLALAEKEHLAVMLIEKQDDGFKVYYSSAFKPFLKQ